MFMYVYMTSDLSNKQDMLLINLNKFYNNGFNMKLIIPILHGETKLSLRIIDWFVTNYSKKHNIIYNIEKRKNGKQIKEQFTVHQDYKNQLKAYSKKQFDPFCRRERIHFTYKKTNTTIVTTVGQLNFFKWLIVNNIIQYMNTHLVNIENDMTENINKHYKSKKHNVRRKRKELSVSATKTVNKHNYVVVLNFD